MKGNAGGWGRRLWAAGVLLLASVLVLAVVPALCGAVAGWVWRWLLWGFQLGVTP